MYTILDQETLTHYDSPAALDLVKKVKPGYEKMIEVLELCMPHLNDYDTLMQVKEVLRMVEAPAKL